MELILQRIRERSLICGLRVSDKPTSDNLKPQETTSHANLEVGVDGAELSCPGSSGVAKAEFEAARSENSLASEAIDGELLSSLQSESFADELEADDDQAPDHARAAVRSTE